MEHDFFGHLCFFSLWMCYPLFMFVFSNACFILELKLLCLNLTQLCSNIGAPALLMNKLLKKKKTNIKYFYLHFINFDFRHKVCSFSLHTRGYRLHIWNPNPIMILNQSFVSPRIFLFVNWKVNFLWYSTGR